LEGREKNSPSNLDLGVEQLEKKKEKKIYKLEKLMRPCLSASTAICKIDFVPPERRRKRLMRKEKRETEGEEGEGRVVEREDDHGAPRALRTLPPAKNRSFSYASLQNYVVLRDDGDPLDGDVRCFSLEPRSCRRAPPRRGCFSFPQWLGRRSRRW
jgi:hypothetical protein